MIRSNKVRQSIQKLQASFKGKTAIDGSSVLIPSGNESEYVKQLQQNGFIEIENKISGETLDEIVNFSKELKLFDPFNRKFGDFNYEQIPENTHVANFHRNDLVGNKSIMDIANDPGVLRVVQDFLGAKPTISNVNMWWSIAGKSQAKDAQLFHRDVDDVKFCKLFLYLTDVSLDSGPHTYVKGSSSTNKLTKIRRYQDEEIEKAFGKENIIDLVRPKGSCFIVDTYGFHRGLLPEKNNRLLLQIQYSLNPIGIEKYEPQEIESTYDKYINRLLIK